MKYTLFIATVIGLSYVAFTSDMNYMRNTRVLSGVYYEKTVYKAIPVSDSAAGDLLGFELRKRYKKTSCQTESEYNVIVRNLNPTVDIYKTYCRDIIRDITTSASGDEHLVINVFDSIEAYNFYVADDLYKNDEDLLANHLVATYEAIVRSDGQYNTLTFYPYSANELRESAMF